MRKSGPGLGEGSLEPRSDGQRRAARVRIAGARTSTYVLWEPGRKVREQPCRSSTAEATVRPYGSIRVRPQDGTSSDGSLL